jgi:hypothetical protein
MLLPRCCGFRAKSFRPPSEAELLLFCLSTCTQDACANSEVGLKGEGQDARRKREVTKTKRHPAGRLPGIVPGKSVSRGRAFRPDIGQPLRRCLNSGIHADARSAACRPRLTAAQETPGRAAGHPGPHSVCNRCAVAKAEGIRAKSERPELEGVRLVWSYVLVLGSHASPTDRITTSFVDG